VGFVALLVTQAVGVTVPLIIKGGIDALASIDARGEYLESCVWGAAAVGAVEMWESGAFCRIPKRGGKSGKLAF